MQIIGKIRPFLVTHRWDVITALIIFVVAAVPRLIDLGVFLTADEKNWIGRSYEFIRAFKDWRFNDMLQTTHPGVTTMWLSGLAVTAKMILSSVPFSFRNLIYFVTAAQFPIALMNAMAVPAMYLLLRQVLPKNWLIPVLASLFIALDPLFIGYSRVAHADALLASLLFLAALTTILYIQRGYQRSWLIASSVLSVLAILTKFPGLFIVPFFVLTVLAKEKAGLFTKQVLAARARDFIIWTLLMSIIFLLAWPALIWVDNPAGNVYTVQRDLGRAALTPHHMTEDYSVDSGHYPAALLTRTNPVALIFSVAFVVWLLGTLMHLWNIRSGTGERTEVAALAGVDERRFLWLIISYAFWFVVMMTLVAKKGDRYILPVFPAIDLMAALGVIITGAAIARIWKMGATNLKIAMLVLPVISVLYLGTVVIRYHPYAIAYSNPFFPDNLSQELGWGEGLEQVGAWLAQNAPDAVVASWYPEELAAYTSAQVAHINAHQQGRIRYVVLYRNMFGRAPDHPANDFIDEYYKKRKPVYVAYVTGKEFAWVYEKQVFERVVGEITPQLRTGQEVQVTHNDLVGLDILAATYNGRATAGDLIIELKEQVGGRLIQRWELPVATIENDRWITVSLPEPLQLSGQEMLVEIYGRGTTSGNAPTVRYTQDFNYRPTDIILSNTGVLADVDTKKGDLAVRLRYQVNGQTASEEDTKLLE